MKTHTKSIIIMILVAVLLLIAAATFAGTKKIGVTIVPDTTKVYKGAKGGSYFWKLSAKTGKVYKHYLPKQK